MSARELESLGGGNNNLSPSGFFNHLFNFDDDNRSLLLNMFQYIFIAIIPVVLILKGIKEYIPEENDKKDTLELLFEIVLQIAIIFFGIYFVDKFIRYFPTYSKVPYIKQNELNFIIPLLFVLFTMQTKLGSKVNILYQRLIELWDGKQNPHVGNTNHGNVNANQSINTPGIHQVSRADTLDNTIIKPPINQIGVQNNTSLIDNLPNMMDNNGVNGGGGLSSFQNQAIQNSFMESMEPMAANVAFGGAFGSSF